MAIRIKAKERQCSEALVIESAVLGASYNGITPGFEPDKVGSTPTATAIHKYEKRAMFDELKAKLASGEKISFGNYRSDVGALESAKAPAGPPPSFDVSISGEPHVVIIDRTGWARYYKSEDGPCNRRSVFLRMKQRNYGNPSNDPRGNQRTSHAWQRVGD